MQLSSCKHGSRRTGLLATGFGVDAAEMVQVPALTAPAGGQFRRRCSGAGAGRSLRVRARSAGLVPEFRCARRSPSRSPSPPPVGSKCKLRHCHFDTYQHNRDKGI